MSNIGILNPGAMGISIAVSAKNAGNAVYWASQNRGIETRGRAEEHSLNEVSTVAEMCERCSVILCVCPPHAAEDVAQEVAQNSFSGIFADLNAIAPARAERIGGIMDSAGIGFVDGGIIGGPAWQPGRTWLYLSGVSAEEIAKCFSDGPLETEVIGDVIGKASALKMCFAANTKGSTALITAVVAASDALGVRADLEKQWARHAPEFVAQTMSRISGVSQKAWRFSGEMKEIASTFESAGLPGGFHMAAAELYERIAGFKAMDPPPEADEVIDILLKGTGRE